MTLSINNFGPINSAKINIGKINVITGQNGSGKTTSSKLIYSLLASVSFDGVALLAENIKDRFDNVIMLAFSKADYDKERTTIAKFSKRIDQHFNDLIELKSIIDEFKEFLNEKELDYENIIYKIEEINNIFQFSKDKEHMNTEILSTLLKKEFNLENQLNKSSKVCLYSKSKCNFQLSMEKENEKEFIISFNNKLSKCLNVNDVVYLETPYILDLGNTNARRTFFGNFIFHQDFLIEKLKDNSIDKDIFDKDLNNEIDLILDEIKEIVEGELYFDYENNDFKFKKNDKIFDMKDTANGQKQIGILQLLLKNRKLSKNSYLIIDEPEAHLHPDWQLKLIKVLFLLVKKLNITLYINSHSPNFIEGLEVFSENYGLGKDICFYSTHYIKDLNKYDFKRIPLNNLHTIYKTLGSPYEEINEIRGKNIVKKLLK